MTKVVTAVSVASAGAFVFAPATPLDAHTADTVVTEDCIAYPQNSLAGGPQASPSDFTYHATAPDTVLTGETFTITMNLDPLEIPTTASGYNINSVGKVFTKIPDPNNVLVNSVTASTVSTPGWSMSRAAGVTTLTNNNTFSPNPPPKYIQVPALTYNVTATAPINNYIDMRLGGAPTYNNNSNPSLQFYTNVASPIGALDVILKCFAPGTPPVSLHTTAIVPPDTTGPAITITRPANGASYAQGQSLTAAYSCTDPSGVASCSGTLPNGASIDTTTPGNYTFTVNATDNKGNPSTLTSSYAVVNLPVVQIHGGTRTESGGPVPFDVTLTKPANVTVNLTTQDGSATSTDDYDSATPSATFTTSGPLTQSVSVALKTDAIAEDPENFSVVATGTTGDSVAIGTSSPGRIIDDDQGGDVDAACGTANEGSDVTCTVQLLRVPTVPTTVTYQTTDGTAVAPGDYASTSGSLTFNPGVYPMIQTLTVPTVADATYEGGIHGDPEEFGFTASVAGGGSASDNGTIAEATAEPPKLYIQDIMLKETDLPGGSTSNARIRMTLDKPASAPVTMLACTVNGSAMGTTTIAGGGDFLKKCPKITLMPGQIWKEIPLAIVPDNVSEGDEAFTVKLINIAGPILVGDDTSQVTIVDDDSPTASTVDVSVSDVTIWEGDQQGTASNTNSALVNISLSHPLAQPVVIKWQAIALAPAPGAATKNVDFKQSTLPGTPFGTVKIGAGARTAQAKVNILPDSEEEGTEAFRVTFYAHHPTGITLNYLKPVGTVTILDDDPLAPGPPSNLVGAPSVAMLGGVDLTWNAPGNDGGSAVTGYEYRISTDGDLDTEPWVANPSGRGTSVKGIACGTTCKAQVRAVNSAGQGPGTTSPPLIGCTETVAPEVTLTAPIGGANIDKNSGVTFTGDAGIEPTDSAPITVNVYSGTNTSGSLVRTLSTTASTGSFSVSTAAFPVGIYTAIAEQSDWAANVGQSNTVTFESHDAIFVSPAGADSNAGTAAAPKQTIAAAITAAGGNTEIVIGTGAYAEASGGIAPMNNQVLVGGFNQYNGWTRPGTAGVGGQPNPLDTSISAVGQAMLVSGTKTVTARGLALNGLNTGLPAGSSVYGVRAVTNAVVNLDRVVVSAQAAIAAANSVAVGTNQTTAPCNGANGATNSGGAGGASCNATNTTGARSGKGGNGGGFLGSGSYGNSGGCGPTTPNPTPGSTCTGSVANPELGGSGGAGGGAGIICIGSSGASAGGSGPGGAGGGPGAAGSNAVTAAGVTYAGLNGGTSAAGLYGRGGGGGGGGSCSSGGGGAGGGGGLTGGGTVTGGSSGGGSFGIYAFNATVTVTNSTISSDVGGAGGKGGTGGKGSNGGNGGTGTANRAAGGGGGGGAGGAGGGGGGAGGPSITIFQTGTGGVTQSGNTLSRATSPAAGGAGGTAGAGGTGGNGGAGNAGTGAAGGTGGAGTVGQPGAAGLLCKTNIAGVCTA